MATVEIYPFCEAGAAGAYPDWIRALRKRSGAYLIHEHGARHISYIGESSTNRLYSTLTRHFQQWTNKYNTAGATYDRADVEVAVIVVPAEHANFLQNELTCTLGPTDNRAGCEQIFNPDQPETYQPPPGYAYDIDQLLEAVAYQWPDDDEAEELPF